MTNYVRKVQHHDRLNGSTHVHTTMVSEQAADQGIDRLQRLVYYIASVGSGLLFIRFVLSLFGANRTNAFADFIYSLTNPLVRPFQNLFGVDTTYGISRMEVETIVAMVVYALLGWMIVSAIDLARKDSSNIDIEA